MRTSLKKGRVCFTCVLKGVFLLPPHRKRTNASSAPKGRVATSLTESIRAHGHLRFLLRSLLPFRESFILSDGHVLRLMYSRQNYEAAHEEKKQRRRESFFTQEQKEKSLCLRGLFDDDEKQIKKFLHNSLVIKKKRALGRGGVNT